MEKIKDFRVFINVKNYVCTEYNYHPDIENNLVLLNVNLFFNLPMYLYMYALTVEPVILEKTVYSQLTNI
jgi:hypothetical protein